MRLHVCACCLALACGSTKPPAPRGEPQPASDAVLLATANDRDVRLVAVSSSGTRVLRQATVPARVDALDWLGGDPIVLLQRRVPTSCGLPEEAYSSRADYESVERDCQAPSTRDGVIGRVTAAGFVDYPALPASTWNAIAAKPSDDAEPCTHSCWRMHVIRDEVWQAHCTWVFSADGSEHCSKEAYARIDRPGPLQTDLELPATADAPMPAIAPSPRVSVTFDVVTPGPRFEGEKPEGHNQMHCTLDGKERLVYPPLADLDLGMTTDVTWLSTDPPMFAANHLHGGFDVSSELLVFEGCTRTRYDRVLTGPGGLVAITDGSTVEIRRNGVLVGKTDGGEHIAFAPRP